MSIETIAAIATAPGEGAISIIRISGQEAVSIAQKIFTKPVETLLSHTAYYGKILDAQEKPIDTVLLMLMRAPKSYTGEDSVEIFCHGGSLVTRKVLERVYQAGARPANPGEFSLRAYLNKKIDLAQAEAVQQLIHAKNELALQAAEKQLQGALSQMILEFQKELLDIGAIIEASIDFPEDDLAFATTEELCIQLEKLSQKMERLDATFHHGKILNTGISLCLLGAPNVGKSSLMNALLKKNRAIVTPIAGTTRDLLEEDLRLGSFHFRLIDTAGLRNTEEIIEQEGIARSKQAMHEADLILLVCDATKPLEEELLSTVPKEKTIVVWNKIDIAQELPSLNWHTSVAISAKTQQGLDLLEQTVENFLWKRGPPSKEEVTITQLRHHTALQEAIRLCKMISQGLQTNLSPELITSDLRSCLNALGTIIGMDVTEDLLSAIFSKFCLGK